MAISYQDRLYIAQAERITNLRKEIQFYRDIAHELHGKYESVRKPAEYYLALMEILNESEMLRDEWRRFIAVLTLYNPSLPGLTCPETTHPKASLVF